jgi:hypothetical protein
MKAILGIVLVLAILAGPVLANDYAMFGRSAQVPFGQGQYYWSQQYYPQWWGAWYSQMEENWYLMGFWR